MRRRGDSPDVGCTRRARVLDWFIVQGEDSLCWNGGYPAGIAAVTEYDGAGLAGEIEVIPIGP